MNDPKMFKLEMTLGYLEVTWFGGLKVVRLGLVYTNTAWVRTVVPSGLATGLSV